MSPTSERESRDDSLTDRAQRIRAVLFDATGTLFDTRESVGTVYSRVAAQHGVALPAWRLDDAFKRIVAGAVPRVFPECDLEQAREREEQWWRAAIRSTFLAADSTVKFDDPAAFYGELFDYYKCGHAWALRPGAAEGLRELRRNGLATGVISNFDQRLPEILQALGVHDLLDVVMIPARCGCEKPASGIFEAALREIGVPPAAAIFVGDDPEKDRAAAEQVGMQSLDPEILDGFQHITGYVEALNDKHAPSTDGQAR